MLLEYFSRMGMSYPLCLHGIANQLAPRHLVESSHVMSRQPPLEGRVSENPVALPDWILVSRRPGHKAQSPSIPVGQSRFD